MRNSTKHRDSDVDLTLGGRLAAAFASLYFSVPLLGLFWILFNTQILLDSAIPLSYLGVAVAAFAVISFVSPKLAPSLFGWLCDRFLAIAKWW